MESILQAVVVIGILGFVIYQIIGAILNKNKTSEPTLPQNVLNNTESIEWEVNEDSLLDKINKVRQDYKKAPLIKSDDLYLAAENRVKYNIKHNPGTISHDGLIVEVHKLLEKGFNWVGENLAYGYTRPGNAFNSWFNSEDHKANMLNENWKYTAIVIRKDKDGKNIYCQLFGK